MQNVSNEPHCAFQFVAIDMDMGTLQHQQLLWTEHRRKQFLMNMNKMKIRIKETMVQIWCKFEKKNEQQNE